MTIQPVTEHRLGRALIELADIRESIERLSGWLQEHWTDQMPPPEIAAGVDAHMPVVVRCWCDSVAELDQLAVAVLPPFAWSRWGRGAEVIALAGLGPGRAGIEIHAPKPGEMPGQQSIAEVATDGSDR